MKDLSNVRETRASSTQLKSLKPWIWSKSSKTPMLTYLISSCCIGGRRRYDAWRNGMSSSGRNAYRTLIKRSLILMRALIIWMMLKIDIIKWLQIMLQALPLEIYKLRQPFKDKNSILMKSKERQKTPTLSKLNFKIMKNVQTNISKHQKDYYKRQNRLVNTISSNLMSYLQLFLSQIRKEEIISTVILEQVESTRLTSKVK